mmetsp:Transcript_52810/g.120195  ORF Transcript_52810/g.120195 Transcript_52810/m.120195 type:complete len:291 (+) Transcript_52810:1457-2329(+)
MLSVQSGHHLIHLPTPGIHLQPERGDHVSHSLHRAIDVVIGISPRHNIHLAIQLGVGLLAQLHDVGAKLVAPLVCLLQRGRHILHPRIVRLQRLLHVPHVQPHGRDLRSHSGLHSLPARNDRMCGINPSSHLIQIHIHSVHSSSEILHITLAGQHDTLHVCGVALGAGEHVLQLADVVLEGVDVRGDLLGGRAGGAGGAGQGGHGRSLLVQIAAQLLHLLSHLCLKIRESGSHFLHQLPISCFTAGAKLADTAGLLLPIGQHSCFKLLEPVSQLGTLGLRHRLDGVLELL